MKRNIITFLIIICSLNVQAKDFNKTEEMIDTILSEESSSAVKQDKAQAEQKAGDESAITGEAGDDTGPKDNAEPSRKNTMSGKDESVYKTAIQLFETGYYDHSLAKFNEIISSYGDSKFIDNAHVWAGRIYIKKYRYDDAIK